MLVIKGNLVDLVANELVDCMSLYSDSMTIVAHNICHWSVWSRLNYLQAAVIQMDYCCVQLLSLAVVYVITVIRP